MNRTLFLLYGVASYATFFLTYLYAIGFIGNLVVPKSIDSQRTAPLAVALGVNSLLLGLFAVQHSVMARPAFKRWWTRFVPEPIERSTYVLFSSLALILLFAAWQPMGGTAWKITHPVGQAVLYGLFVAGWLIVLMTTFLINHFDLFGLRQTWLYFREKPYTPLKFKTPGPYKIVRHPLYVGWLLAFWCTPTMTAAHLLFAAMSTVYILVAIRLEERDLITAHPDYLEYRKQVPMLVPQPGRRWRGEQCAEAEQSGTLRPAAV